VKKILIILFLVFLWTIFVLNFSYSEENTCWYTGKIDTCLNSNDKRALAEGDDWFICLSLEKRELVAYQIVLDEKFNEIDKIIEDEYLATLEEDKDRFFWPNASENYINASDEIEEKFAKYSQTWYWKDYKEICWVGEWSIINDTLSCLTWDTGNENEATVWLIRDYFKESTCMELAEFKLYIYRQVAYDILLMNKLNVMEDSAKLHMQGQRDNFDDLTEAMNINEAYIDRVYKKTPSFTENVY